MTPIDELLPRITIILVIASFGTSSRDLIVCDLVDIVLEVDVAIALRYLAWKKIAIL